MFVYDLSTAIAHCVLLLNSLVQLDGVWNGLSYYATTNELNEIYVIRRVISWK